MTTDSQRQGALRLARALLSPHDPAECERALDRLDAFCAAQLAGQPLSPQFDDLATHLDACVACSESYALLYEALSAGDHPAAVATPTPDLSFLGSRPDQRAAFQALLERAARPVPGGMRFALSPALLERSQPRAAAMAVRSGEQQPLIDVTWSAPGERIDEFQCVALAGSDDDVCDLRLRVRLEGRSWPDLEGITLNVQIGAERRRLTTDAWGEALVQSVRRAALPNVRIEVLFSRG